MGIYRGIGGTGDSTSDATLEAVTQKAVEADASADAAAISETNAASSASSAQTYANNAATSASAASSSASSSATSASNASTSASTATTKASEATTSATNAASSATSAATSASTATTAKDAALAALDSFDDKYLGAKASDPSVDNDGNALSQGTLYYNTTSNVMKVYSGSVWVATYVSLSGALLASNNLSDVVSASSSRTNLGLGTIATQAANNVNITGGSISSINDLAVADGGTGASTASGARTNLGLVIGTDVLSPTGSAASLTSFPTLNQNTTGTASNVTGTVAIANGGTGATTAGAALTALGAYAASNPSGYTSNTGTVTSVTLTTPTGLSVSGSPITTSGTLALSMTAGYAIPTTASQANWDTAYGWGNHASAGYLTTSTAASTYAPLTGTGTSGTWGISITGNAATATNVAYSGLTGTVPTWNQNTTGTASNVTGTVAVANGGTGATTASDARTNLGLVIGTDVLSPTGSAASLTSFPTFNQNTTGTAANITASSNSTLTTLSLLSLPYSQLSGTVPTWNQNTTGTASNVTGTVAISNGGTGATTLAGASIVTYTGTETLTNKDIVERVVAIADGTSITINADTTDIATQANTQAAGTLTINAPTGTPVNGQKLVLRLLSTNVQTFSWNAIFVGSTDLPLPTASTGSSNYDYLGFVYNSTAAKWQLLAKVFGF